uniref:Cystathionine gamma-lyase n=1 Tax=Catagonus wagneri TaxID=51154 RepID=A0A8C3W640_9CETA
MQERDASPHGFLPRFQHFATQAIHVGQDPEQWASKAVVPPISLSTTFKQGAPGKHSGFEYSRSGNPTRNCLEKAVAALDGAKYRSILICIEENHRGTNRYFRKVATEFGLKISFVDCSKIKLLEAAITPETKLVWIETPTNPNLKMIDIEACAHTVHKHGDIILVVDNTFMSAYFQPLSTGAKEKHRDRVLGAVEMSSFWSSIDMFIFAALGAVPSPVDCYLCNRGLKTLHVRMEKHFENGMAVAQFLESHPLVEKVIYPGLPSHPQHELAKRQCTGCPGMITFYVKGSLQHAETFLKNLKVFTLAESLGGYESLAELPAIMTHASVPESDREVLGIRDTLIRLSVGLEDKQDLMDDLDQALKAAHPTNASHN